MQNNDQRGIMKGYILLVIIFLLSLWALIFSDVGNQTRVYDCGMAEWHPDIPNAVKEECRRLHYEEWKRQQDERKNDPGVHENRRGVLTT